MPLAAMFMLAACGSSSNENTTRGPGVSGVVYTQQGPVADAAVVLKTYNGALLGSTTTNSNGAYYVPTAIAGPYIAEATLPSGITLYSISQNDRMNVTHLGDFMLRRWYTAMSLTLAPNLFAGIDSDTPVPEEGSMDGAVDQILGPIISALQFESLDLFQDEISTGLEKVLRGTTISNNTLTITMTDPAVSVSITVEATPDTDGGGVVFSGKQTITTAQLDPTNLALPYPRQIATYSTNSDWTQIASAIRTIFSTLSPISKAYAATVENTNLSAAVDNAKKTESNENWMSDNWEFIKDKKLADIVIPGTHDSGTYKLGWGSGINTAKTQHTSIGQQLKDGIRYFDMRVTEAAHRGCADYSVWWLYHTWKSYRLQEALDEIKLFVNKPGNSKEVVILDFQDIAESYQDARAIDVLLDLIQNRLGAHMVPMDQTKNWHNSSLADFIAQGRQIIVLVPGGTSTRVNASGFTPGCGARLDGKYFWDRGSKLRNHYTELTESQQIQDQIITPQLQKGSASGDELFNAYRKHQAGGLLNVIQIVPRPSNIWYATAILSPGGGYPLDLLTYASHRINAPLNRKMAQSDVNDVIALSLLYPLSSEPLVMKYCASGWLGKRLIMGVQGNPDQWNKPNVIIVDNYKPLVAAAKFDWVLPKYDQGWKADWQGSYVDYIIRLNQLARSSSLPDMPNFEDASCLN